MEHLDFVRPDVDWLADLPRWQRETINEMLKGSSEEVVAQRWLEKSGASTTAGYGTSGFLRSYFDNFIAEFDGIICGDEKYADLRKKAGAVWEKQGNTGLVALLAGTIAIQLNIAAVVLVPVISLCLNAVGRMSVGAYCRTRRGG